MKEETWDTSLEVETIMRADIDKALDGMPNR